MEIGLSGKFDKMIGLISQCIGLVSSGIGFVWTLDLQLVCIIKVGLILLIVAISIKKN
jgi:hypothetical protein